MNHCNKIPNQRKDRNARKVMHKMQRSRNYGTCPFNFFFVTTQGNARMSCLMFWKKRNLDQFLITMGWLISVSKSILGLVESTQRNYDWGVGKKVCSTYIIHATIMAHFLWLWHLSEIQAILEKWMQQWLSNLLLIKSMEQSWRGWFFFFFFLSLDVFYSIRVSYCTFFNSTSWTLQHDLNRKLHQ